MPVSNKKGVMKINILYYNASENVLTRNERIIKMCKKIVIACMFILLLLFLSVEVPLCDSINGKAEAGCKKDESVPPTKKKKLLKWLKAGNYLETYTAEPEIHVSTGPHGGNVRTYYNPILVDDLNEGKTKLSRCATMIKELYFSGEEEVIGYAVMIKVKKKSRKKGKGWLFYETFDGTNEDASYGKGISECADCHRDGVDYLLSDFRP